MKRGKGYTEAAKLVDRSQHYGVTDAVGVIRKTADAKFDKTVELHVRTGTDNRHADQQIRDTVVLPHSTGKTAHILVFARGSKEDGAKAAGIDFVGGQELIPKIQNEGWFDFDIVVATPDMMGVVGRLSKVFGPKGLIPNPKSGTVTMDLIKTIADTKVGKVEYHLDKINIIHYPVDKTSFTEEQLRKDLQTPLDALNKAKPLFLKSAYMENAVLTSTMGPGVKLNTVKIAD